MKNRYIFFRNDDVRDILDKSLFGITKLFIKYNIPITHAVEPANVSQKVIYWLTTVKKQHPNLIEIIQHGYNHNRKGKFINQEFGGKRKYQDQYEDIRKGKELMDKYFGDLWTPIFTFPYGKYNKYTMQALNNLGYIGISSSIKYNWKNNIINKVGKFFKKDNMLYKNNSYHPYKRINYNFYEISVTVNIIKEYINYDVANHFSYEEIIKSIEYNLQYTDIIGILFHHRYHTDQKDLIEKIIKYSIRKNFRFSTIKSIINGKV